MEELRGPRSFVPRMAQHRCATFFNECNRDLSTARDTTGGGNNRRATIALRREFSEPTSCCSVGTFVVSRAGKAYDARGEFRARTAAILRVH